MSRNLVEGSGATVVLTWPAVDDSHPDHTLINLCAEWRRVAEETLHLMGVVDLHHQAALDRYPERPAQILRRMKKPGDIEAHDYLMTEEDIEQFARDETHRTELLAVRSEYQAARTAIDDVTGFAAAQQKSDAASEKGKAISQRIADTLAVTGDGVLAKLLITASIWEPDEWPDAERTWATDYKMMASSVKDAAHLASGTAPLAPSTIYHPDAELLRHLAEFHRLYGLANAARAARMADREAAEAHPDCPPPARPGRDQEAYERRNAFVQSRMADGAGEHWTETLNAAIAKRDAGLAIRAETIGGIIAKLEVIRLIVGDGDMDGDEDIVVPGTDPWFAEAIKELGRMAGGGVMPNSGPIGKLAALEAELFDLEANLTGKLESDEAERTLMPPINELMARIAEAPVETFPDLAVKIRRLYEEYGTPLSPSDDEHGRLWSTTIEGVERLEVARS